MTDFMARIIEAASRGALVLTANKRLARFLRSRWDEWMQQQGLTVWQTPQIISYEAWLHSVLGRAGEGWRLLGGPAALRLWEELIEESSAGSELELLQIPATARKAQEAHLLLCEYGCGLEEGHLTEDQRIFRRWRQRFRQVCRDKDWIDRGGLPGYIRGLLRDGRETPPDEVVLVGFDQWSPDFDALGQVLEEKGSSLKEFLPDPDPRGRVRRVSCIDADDEIEQAARWARRLLEGGASSIGIVVLDLHSRRRRIERVFREQIDPGASLAPGSEEETFSLSLGAPLADQGAVHTALELLSLDRRAALEQVSALLRSPYLAGSRSEGDRRAQFDRELRSWRQKEINLPHLARITRESVPKFSRILEKLSGSSRSRQFPGEWAWRFDRLLHEAGWPGDLALSSREYQVIKAWKEKLLPAMASLDPVSRPMRASEALSVLRRLASEMEFQVESRTGPVQVVGVLESAGLEFDHLWVVGMNEDAFPAPSRPNPFIPLGVQMDNRMPHSSAARELSFARRVLDRLMAASADIVFSYARRSADCDLRPSPLLEGIEEGPVTLAEPADPVRVMRQQRAELTEIRDTRGPAVSEGLASGGTAILKDQALCPFRGYALHRLKCQALESPQPGVDAMTRGTLLHRALEYIWRELETAERLQALDREAMADLARRHVGEAMEDCFAKRPKPEARLLELERQRLCSLIGEWLEQVEKDRRPFRVEEIEQEHIERIGPLTIRTVVDRIDRLSDGRTVILDYKTGQVRADRLVGERLLEPQLPIYATGAAEGGADAVAFARVRRAECRMVGIARESGLLPKVDDVASSKAARELGILDWSHLLRHWRGQLEALAAGFADGEASVDPVSFADACQYCDLGGLCRIAERRAEEGSDE